jgi:hypothetical protein
MSTAVKYLFGIGMLLGVIANWFWFRMIRELNTVLPPAKHIFWWQNRERYFEIKSLHEELFPTGRNRTAWFVLTVLFVSLLILAVVLAVKPK